MKGSELQIGDWVQGFVPDSYSRVYGIFNEQRIAVIAEPIKTYIELSIDDVQPIPLTSEILEKNGFVLKEEEEGLFRVKIAPHYIRDDVPFEVFCDGEPFAVWFKDPVNIEYVHQLQQALRLCGIDKEIVVC